MDTTPRVIVDDSVNAPSTGIWFRCSLGIHRDDVEGSTGGTLHSLLTVSWRDIAWAPRSVSAARAVATADEHTPVEYLDLPSGPASLDETVRTPAPESVLMVSTTAVERREQYREILRQIAQLTTFESPLTEA